MTNHSGTRYIGVTNNLRRRVEEHKHFFMEGFAKRYKIIRLVYFEETSYVQTALEREKELKGWVRSKNVQLIESMKLEWKDLSNDW
jgi:putative endonuclease